VCDEAGPEFQFHFGAIQTITETTRTTCLKIFQFHFGAIQTLRLFVIAYTQSEFQFHFGAIQTVELRSLRYHQHPISIPLWCDSNSSGFDWRLTVSKDFNSTLVRFKHSDDHRHTGSAFAFQFHFGAIQTGTTPVAMTAQTTISIPLWCDSNRRTGRRRVSRLKNFNSTLMRFKQKVPGHQRRHSIYFNSTLVRFKQTSRTLNAVARIHFNSTLVRFKQRGYQRPVW